MASNISSERSSESTERYAFGKPLSKKYIFGVTNKIGDPKENAKTNYDYVDQVNRLKKIRDENERSKDAEELAKPKEIAKTAVRAELEVKQREHVEVEARTIAILETQLALMNKIVEDTKASLREVYAKQMKEEVYAQYEKTAAAHKEEVRSELAKALTAEMKAQYAAQARNEVTKQRDEELRSGSIRLKGTLKSEVESKLIDELSPEVKIMLRAELIEPVKQELRKELKAEVYAEREKISTDCEKETRLRLMHELIPAIESKTKKELRDHIRREVQEEMREEVRAKVTESVYDDPTDHNILYQDNDHYDDRYDSREHRYQDDSHYDNDDQNDDYNDYEEPRYCQRDQHSRERHRDNRSRSPKRLNRDEQPSYHPSWFQHNEDLSFHCEKGDETDHVDEVREAAPPSSALSSAFRGIKRSRFEQEYDEDGYWGRSPKRTRISGYGGEEEDGESGEGREEFDTRGSSKEDAIDLVDSESESEAIVPKVAAPVTRSGPFQQDSDDEGYAQTESFLLGVLSQHHASTGQDAQVKESVGWEELPDYESEGEFDGEKTLVAGGEGLKNGEK